MPTAAPAQDTLERSCSFFESALWETEAGSRILAYIARSGVEEPVLRSFRIGYAPGNTGQLLEHLSDAGHEPDDLVPAGLASRSDRSHLHVLFHARIMFPIADAAGTVLGFAGLATHLGPSWPLWVTSPDDGRFDPGMKERAERLAAERNA